MKILWHGVGSQYHSGYGIQTGLFTRKLKERGHDVVISDMASHSNATYNSDGIKTLPHAKRFDFGNSFFKEHVAHEKPDVVFILMDAFVIDPSILDIPAKKIMWAVVDSYPLRRDARPALDKMDRIVAMSRFGQITLSDAGYSPDFCPHAIATKVFFASPECLRDRRSIFPGLSEDTFVVSCVGVNNDTPCRKGFEYLFEAWSKFIRKHPDSMLYVHTSLDGRLAGDGINIPLLIDFFKIPQDNIRFPPQYEYNIGVIPNGYLNKIFNASDYYIMLSLSEAFCVPVVEAQASGCPVIVNDCSSLPELCLTGSMVSCTKVMNQSCTYKGIPDVDDVLDKLEIAYNSRHIVRDYKHRSLVSKKVAQFDIDMVFNNYFVHLIES